jgi:hypothetical protein
VKVPAFLLRRLYVPGSLRNTDLGWEFVLRNSLGSGEAVALEPLVLDAQTLPPESCTFHLDDTAVPFSAVDDDHRFGLDAGKDIVISVAGPRLTAGCHTVAMTFTVPALGRLELKFIDEVP